MYPAGFGTWIEPGEVAAPLEGARRPGHFRGVATVVQKLFGILEPDRAYFGEKDAQQLAVIRAMVRDLDVPVAVVGCPIVREADGLALSSRNRYLDADDRRAAPVLFRALSRARELWRAGERDAEVLRGAMRDTLAAEPRARVDYVSVSDPGTFLELDRVAGPALLSLAAFVGAARLIDNVRLDDSGSG
jgi:pantoate--beta-alanine ligase